MATIAEYKAKLDELKLIVDALEDNYRKLNQLEKLKEYAIRKHRKLNEDLRSVIPTNLSELSGYIAEDALGRRFRVNDDGTLELIE